MTKAYDDFFEALGQRESRGNYSAISMVKNVELDGVIVTNQKRNTYLRTPPDQKTDNNLVS